MKNTFEGRLEVRDFVGGVIGDREADFIFGRVLLICHWKFNFLTLAHIYFSFLF
jgi:hypothetical protein